MEVESAKLIAAGLAVLPLLGVGIGIGKYFCDFDSVNSKKPRGAEECLFLWRF